MTEYTKEIYESEYGYGYKIFINGKLTIIQPHAPGVPGLKGMTSSEANKYADEVIEQMSKPPEEMMHATRMDGGGIATGIRRDAVEQRGD